MQIAGTCFAIGCAISMIVICKLLQSEEATDKRHPGRKFANTGIYGNSEFEQPWQYRSNAQIRRIDKCIGHVYGQLGTDGRECIDTFDDPEDPAAHNNQHTFAIGASGSGKSYTVGKLYCLQSIKMGHSVIHTDPKGELFSDLADIYRKHGYIVRRINFNNPNKSDGWDCMKTLREEKNQVQVELNSAEFAAAVVSNIVDDLNSIYYSGPLMLLQALILRLVLDDSIPEEEKNIKTVYKWLTDPAGVDFLDMLFDENTVPDKAKSCVRPYTVFKGSSANLQGNLKTNLGAGIQILSTGIIADILSTDDIDLTLPGKKPCAYFVQFPVPNNPYKFPIALFFTMIFQTLQQEATRNENQKLKVQVDFFLDEFGQCGVFPSWGERMSVIRSFGINVFMIVQTLAQFKKNYKDSDETIVSNCATWLMLGANDKSSAQYFCERLGQTSIEVQSESRSGIRKALGFRNSITDRTSLGVGKTNLLSPDEIMKFPANELLIVYQRHNPIWANAVPWTLHPYSKNAKKTNDDEEPGIYEHIKRVERNEIEKNNVDYYWKTHSVELPPANIRDAPYKTPNTILRDVIEIVIEDAEDLISVFRGHEGNKTAWKNKKLLFKRTKDAEEKKITKTEISRLSTDDKTKSIPAMIYADEGIEIEDNIGIQKGENDGLEALLEEKTSNKEDKMQEIYLKNVSVEKQNLKKDPTINEAVFNEPVVKKERQIEDQKEISNHQKSAYDPYAINRKSPITLKKYR